MLPLIEEVNKIAIQAGNLIMDIYQDVSLFEVESKKDDSPLTKADTTANNYICSELIKLDAEIPIISEENKTLAYPDRKHYTRFWLVDPLDGTKEFIKRNGEFTVNIALIENGHPIMGVVYAPAIGELYFAEKNGGASIRVNDETQPLNANTFTMKDKGLKVVCSRSHLNEETQSFIDALDNPEKVSKGSSLKFIILAKGGADIYPRIAPTMEWDTGAAQMVLEEAGGSVVRYDDETPLLYNKESLLNPFFVAYGNKLP